MSVNGERVDGGAGIRSWSQYDRRALYSTYDVTKAIINGNNTLAIYTGRRLCFRMNIYNRLPSAEGGIRISVMVPLL